MQLPIVLGQDSPLVRNRGRPGGWCFPLLGLINVLATRLLTKLDEAVAAATAFSGPGEGRLAVTRPSRLALAEGSMLEKHRRRLRLVIRHKIGQGDLAAMAVVARENVSRVLEQLEAARPGDPARQASIDSTI